MANESERIAIGYPIPQDAHNLLPLASFGKRCLDFAALVGKKCLDCCLLCCCCCCVITFPIVCCCVITFPIVFLALIILLLSIGDASPPHFSVVSASASSFNLTSFPFKLSADFYFTLAATNPNKQYALSYHGIDATLLHSPDSTPILQGRIPPFHQGKGSATTILVSLVAADENLAPYVAWEIGNDMSVHKVLLLDMNLTAQVSFKPAIVPSQELKLQCKDIAIWFATPEAGSRMGPTMSCKNIHNQNW